MALALAWKPAGILSQTFLGEFKKRHGFAGPARQGIGHTGTLDPFAEGLLCIGVEEGTKLLSPLSGLDKTYRASMALGFSSESFDLTGSIEEKVPLADLKKRLEGFDFADFISTKLGPFLQVPPPQSAVHIDGKRAYEWARAGTVKELAARPAELKNLRHLSVSEIDFGEPARKALVWEFEVTVSSGTYIRALARDWGQEIAGHPALLTRLVRTAIGPFRMEESEGLHWLSMKDLQALFEIAPLKGNAAEEFQRYGRWHPDAFDRMPVGRPCLVVNEKGETLGFREAITERTRVFQQNPF